MADFGKILEALGVATSSVGMGLLQRDEREREKKRQEQQDLLFKLGLEDRKRGIEMEEQQKIQRASELASQLLSESGTQLGASELIAPAQGKRVASETIPIDTGSQGEITGTGDRVIQSIATQYGVDPKTLRTATEPIAKLRTEAQGKATELAIQAEIDRVNQVYEGTSAVRKLQQDEEFKIWSEKNAIEHKQRMQAAYASAARGEAITPLQLRNIVNDNMQGTANGIAMRLRQHVAKGGKAVRGVSLDSPADWTQHIANRLRAIYGPDGALEGDIEQEATRAVNNFHPDFEGKKPAVRGDAQAAVDQMAEELRAMGYGID